MNANDSYKYDVAITFLSADLDVAKQLTERLQDRMEVFLFTERQGEVVGPTGIETMNPRFPVRSAELTRAVTCSFRAGRLLEATKVFYLKLLSRDRDDLSFTTGAPGMSRRYYLVCEGRVGTTLTSFAAGQTLSFAESTFTLPCGHMIYRAANTDPAQAERVSGVYAYRVQSATWTVRRGPTVARPTFDVAVDVVVANPVETLHLTGRLLGTLTTSVRAFDCPEHQASKQALPAGCR